MARKRRTQHSDAILIACLLVASLFTACIVVAAFTGYYVALTDGITDTLITH